MNSDTTGIEIGVKATASEQDFENIEFAASSTAASSSNAAVINIVNNSINERRTPIMQQPPRDTDIRTDPNAAHWSAHQAWPGRLHRPGEIRAHVYVPRIELHSLV